MQHGLDAIAARELKCESLSDAEDLANLISVLMGESPIEDGDEDEDFQI